MSRVPAVGVSVYIKQNGAVTAKLLPPLLIETVSFVTALYCKVIVVVDVWFPLAKTTTNSEPVVVSE